MGSRLKWHRHNTKTLMRRRGIESWCSVPSMMRPLMKPRPPSIIPRVRATAAAFLAWRKVRL